MRLITTLILNFKLFYLNKDFKKLNIKSKKIIKKAILQNEKIVQLDFLLKALRNNQTNMLQKTPNKRSNLPFIFIFFKVSKKMQINVSTIKAIIQKFKKQGTLFARSKGNYFRQVNK